MHRAIITVLLLIAVASAAATPNFSGIWKMDPTQSDFGPQEPPQSSEYVIRHVGPTVSFNYTQDGKTTRVDITPDNEERITSKTEDYNTWTRAYWSDSTLILESRERRKFGTQAATGAGWTSRWSLSPDRNLLIIERTLRNAGHEATQRLVYTRQPLPPPNS
jgi:hypothetical protein